MQVEVKPDARMPGGKSAFLQGETDGADQWFMVSVTDLTQPISVGVYTRDPNEKVRVRIVKDDWDKPEREADTSGSGKAEFYFRTFDNFKIGVDADTPTAYQLVVWVGDEPQIAPPDIAVPASEYVEPADALVGRVAGREGKGDGISLSYLEMGLLALLLIIVAGFVAVKLSRRTKN
ncbi:MAG: hypothetical protein ABIP16_01715 [Thermomonas sp.]